MSMRLLVACLALVLSWIAPGAGGVANAADAITGGCSVSVAAVVLLNYDLLTKAAQSGTGDVSVTCTGTGTTSVQIGLTAGNGTCTTRTLINGDNSLAYNIYTTSTFATVWCEQTTRVSVPFIFSSPNVPSTMTKTATMHMRVAASQNVPSGTYTATLGAIKGGSANLHSRLSGAYA